MWQRIQSVFIGIGILSLISGLIYPIWGGLDKGIEYKLYPIYLLIKEQGQGGKMISSTYFPYCISSILMVAVITIAIMEFRRYDNRLLQVKLGTLNSLLLAVLVIFDIYISNQFVNTYPGSFGPGLYLILVAIVCNWVAVRFIRRDEKLVKDSDRIR
jgi:hypothetical protein